MRTFKRSRGYLTFAQQGERCDYLRAAYGLALSLKATQSQVTHLSVLVTPGTKIPPRYMQVFDEIIDIPWNDEASTSGWKLENEWKAFHATPYQETVKLDADMLFTQDIAKWWPMMSNRKVTACNSISTYRGATPNGENPYRACFAANDLPDIYTAFMHFGQNDLALELFTQAEIIFQNWERFFEEFLEPVTRPKFVSTDVVFALAMKLIGPVSDFCSDMGFPNIVHMRSRLQGWENAIAGEQWTDQMAMTVTRNLELKLGRHLQILPVHYHDKKALTDSIITTYEKVLGI